MPAPRVHVPAEDLRLIASRALAAAGLSDEHAATVADAFVWANLHGVDSHGISRLPRYLELLESGEANARPKLETTRVRAAALVIDADQAPGPVALSYAMREAIELARHAGVAWATVRGTVHTGAIGYYTTLASAQGLAGIGIVAGVPNMAYHGARGAAVATSPLSIALPASKHPDFVLDMATATIALGKIAQYKARGESLPAGSALTADGEPTTDAAEAKIPLPAAGAKGSGMSLAFELLASGLAGNPIVAEYHDGTPDGRRHRQNATLIAVDVAAFLPIEEFTQIVDRTIDAVTALPPAGDNPVLVPGGRSATVARKREQDGIPLPARVWESVTEAAARYGVTSPEPVASS
ncbi:MAG TPA: Ldh family oxidoreductase [Solirubrobacteraceae bacterium]|nr:Ldh family oxidoreductase [Solirubrobacteraceae bacterium]